MGVLRFLLILYVEGKIFQAMDWYFKDVKKELKKDLKKRKQISGCDV